MERKALPECKPIDGDSETTSKDTELQKGAEMCKNELRVVVHVLTWLFKGPFERQCGSPLSIAFSHSLIKVFR